VTAVINTQAYYDAEVITAANIFYNVSLFQFVRLNFLQKYSPPLYLPFIGLFRGIYYKTFTLVNYSAR